MAQFFDVVGKAGNWHLRSVLEDQANFIHHNRFSSKKRCQDWADRMNAAASRAGNKPKLSIEIALSIALNAEDVELVRGRIENEISMEHRRVKLLNRCDRVEALLEA